MNNKRWTPEQIKDAEKMLRADVPHHLIAERFGRSTAAIIGLRFRLGLSERQEPDSIKPRAVQKLESALGRKGGLARAWSMENQTNPRHAYHPLHDNARLLTILNRITGA